MNYQDMLKILAQKKLAQKNSSQDYQDEESQPRETPEDQEYDLPVPEVEPDDEQLVAKNEVQQDRKPQSEDSFPITGKEVQLIQGVGILDKIQMKRQGLDPANPDDVKKYKELQTL